MRIYSKIEFDHFALTKFFKIKFEIYWRIPNFKKNTTILLKMRILFYDLTNFYKFIKSRHDIIEWT